MQALSLGEVAELSGGECHALPGRFIGGFATDSRDVKPGDLFIAIPGERFDGHEYAEEAMGSGAIAVMAERPLSMPYILVPSIVEGLAAFGRNLRARFHGPVVGITGSAGKTTTKEFVAAALGAKGRVLKSEGNRNTEYTSPLLWSELEEGVKFVVVEMAMRGFGQIAHLAQISSPNVGIVTNIGHAHLMQLGSRGGIAKAKGELLENLQPDGVAVLWQEDEYLLDLLELNGSRKHYTFGFSPEADCQITGYHVDSWISSHVAGISLGVDWQLDLPAVGRHIALDAAAAILTAHVLGVEPSQSCPEIVKVKLPPMRMEVRDHHGATILLDTYNASPASMLAAIETVSEMPVTGRRLAILGQMLELGEASETGHRDVGLAVQSSHLDQVAFVGPHMKLAREQVESSTRATWSESPEPAKRLLDNLQPGDVLLIKGSRALQLETLLADPHPDNHPEEVVLADTLETPSGVPKGSRSKAQG